MKSGAKFIHLCEKLVQNLLILLLTILFLLFLLIFAIPIVCLLLYRKVVATTTPTCINSNTDTNTNTSSPTNTNAADNESAVPSSKILTSGATILATDDVATDPNLNVVITLTFNGEIRVKDLRQLFQTRILDLKDKHNRLLYPELQQYYTKALGYLFWTRDEDFKLENHVRLYDYADLDLQKNMTKPSSFITQKDICRVKPALMARGWPEGKSPWEFLVVPGYIENPGEYDYEYENYRAPHHNRSLSNDDEDDDDDHVEEEDRFYRGGTILIFRFHHGLADGVGVFRMLWARLAGNGENLNINEEIIKDLPPPIQEQSIKKQEQQPNVGFRFLYYLSLPFRIHFEYVKQLVESNDENAWKLPEDRLLSKNVQSAVTERIPLELIKGIKDRSGVSFSAVILGAVAGAMRKSMQDSGILPPKEIHALLPIPSTMDHGGKLRNHLTYIYPKIPVGIADCGSRLVECESNLKELKSSSIPLMNRLMHRLAGSFPTPLVKCFQKNVFATVLLSNFPGPSSKTFLLGQQMTDMTFATSCHGNNGIRISILSYNSRVRVSVDVNEALPHQSGSLAQQIVANIETELKNLKNCDSPQVV